MPDLPGLDSGVVGAPAPQTRQPKIGFDGSHLGRGAEVESMLRRSKIRLFVLGFNANGSPKHPLYVPYAAEPVEWLAPREGRS